MGYEQFIYHILLQYLTLNSIDQVTAKKVGR